MTDQELQTLRNMGNEAEAAADEIETLRQRVKEWSDRAMEFSDLASRYEEELAALKHGQGEPIGYFCDVNSLTPEQGKRIEQVVESAKDDPDVFPLFATPQTCFSAGDMADAAAKAAQVEREECAKIADARAMRCESEVQGYVGLDDDEATNLRSLAWQFSVLAGAIRMRGKETK